MFISFIWLIKRSNYDFNKQIGGRNQYAKVRLLLEPYQEEMKPIFENNVSKDIVPNNMIPSVQEGVLGATGSGGNNGFPIINCKVTFIDGIYSRTDSTEIAFSTAASMAFKKAIENAGTIVLEPIMRLEILTPKEYLGDVLNDLTRRRSEIQSIDDVGNIKMIEGFVPLSEVFGYTTALRSLSQGRASVTLEPCRYSPVPEEIAEKLFF